MKWTKDAKGKIVGCRARITVGDTVGGGKATNTYAPNGALITARVFTQAAASIPGALIWDDDIPGAYYNGTPAGPEEEGGRALYMPVPDGWDELGIHARDPVTRGRMMIWVPGNCPGRQEAGQVFSAENAKFMTGVGFHISVVDRQLYYKLDSKSELLIATSVHVDDLLSLILHGEAFEEFHYQWTKRFGGKPLGEIECPLFSYLGASYKRNSDRRISVNVGHLLLDLDTKLEELMVCPEAAQLYRLSFDVPMAPDALAKLYTEGDIITNLECHSRARSVIGSLGYIACKYRPDLALAHIAIYQHVAKNFTLWTL